MILSPYSMEKMYEFERREIERKAREYWKWMPLSKEAASMPVKKEVNDK